MALVFYARVSSKDQNLARQLARAEVVNADKVFQDKKSGKNVDRPGLKEMFHYLREGDVVEVVSLDRLSRDYADLKNIISRLNRMKVRLIVDNLPLPNTDNDSLNTALMDIIVSLMGFIAQNEREKIKERQKQGIAEAKKRGVYKGKPVEYSPNAKDGGKRAIYNAVKQAHDANTLNVSRLSKDLGISRGTVYRIIARIKVG